MKTLSKKLKKYFKILFWIIIYFVLFFSSNYIYKKAVYIEEISSLSLILGNFILLIISYYLLNIASATKSITLKIISLLFIYTIIIAALIEVAIYKFSGVAFIAQSFIHFELETIIVGFNIYPYLITFVILTVALVVYILKNPVKVITVKKSIVTSVLLLLMFSYLAYGTAIGRFFINYNGFINSKSVVPLSIEKVSGLEKLGIRPVEVTNHQIQASFNGEKKNIIILYLESYSEFFNNSQRYPNLTPNLVNLTKKYGQFTNYHSTANFTLQGLMSSLCGFLPDLKFGNDDLRAKIQPYQALPCLSDVLNQLGYRQEFFGGARKSFSNKDSFLKSHKFDKVWGWLDYSESKNKKYTHNDWGLHDDDLYEYALDRIIDLHQSKSPFLVSVLNLSTHLSGNPAPSCPKYTTIKNVHKYIQGIHCIDYLIGKFLKNLEKERILENTIVYITSDHGVFKVDLIKKLFGKNINTDKIFGVIVDKEHTSNITKPVGLYDLAPTVLELLNIHTNITFINGKSVFLSDSNRFLLNYKRQQKIKKTQDCNQNNTIDLPLDNCEHSRLLSLSFGHAESFTFYNQTNVDSPHSKIKITSTKKKHELSELLINNNKQDNHFYNAGYLIKDYKRQRNNHLFVWIYDFSQKRILQKRAFNYKTSEDNGFFKTLRKLQNNYIVIIFTDGFQDMDFPREFEKTLVSMGAKHVPTKHAPYIAVYKKIDGKESYNEWDTSLKDLSVSVFLNGIKDPVLK